MYLLTVQVSQGSIRRRHRLWLVLRFENRDIKGRMPLFDLIAEVGDLKMSGSGFNGNLHSKGGFK